MKKLKNNKVFYDYFVIEEYTCGMQLFSSEVKSISKFDINFLDSFCFFKNGELWIKNLVISKYKNASYNNHDEYRDKKLLLKRSELNRISKTIKEKGISLIPIEIIIIRGKFKIKIGICKGKKNWDKRETIKKRDNDRELKRILKT